MRKYKKISKFVNNTGYTPGYASEGNPMNIIPSEDITMRNTPYPLYGQPLDENGMAMGSPTYMEPGKEYKFGGASYVAEVPAYKDGGKSDWISNKIGILMKEGRPQKQAIAIAYSMWNQKHEMGGTQLPKYQFAGTAELDEYGQPLPKPEPAPTFDYSSSKTALGIPPQIPNILKPVDLNAPTAASNKAYADQQAKAPQTISISDSELANPTMNGNIPSKEQKDRMAFNKQVNTAANNYDENGNAIDTSLAAQARKKAEESGMGITQFINPYGDIGMEDALGFSGQQFAKGNTGMGIAGAALGALKGTKSFLQGMGAQKRQNQVMKTYAEEQRKNMTGEGREQSLKMGGYYQEGGEKEYMGYEDDMINKYPNSARVESEIAARNPVFGPQDTPATDWYEEGMDKDTYYGLKNELESAGYESVPKTNELNINEEDSDKWEQEYGDKAPSYDKNSARDTWVAKTGMPWAEAKRLGYTDGSAKDNTKLLSELNNPKFKAENLRKAPVTRKAVNNSNNSNKKTNTQEELWGKPLVNPIEDYVSRLYKGSSEKPKSTKNKNEYVDPYKGLYEDEEGDIRNSKGIMVGLDGQELNWFERNFADVGVIPPMDKNGRRMEKPGYGASIEYMNAWHKARYENKKAEKEAKAKQKAAKEKVAASRKKPVQSKPYVNPFPPTYPSYNPADPMNLNSRKFFQDGGMQPEMGEEQMMMGNPQEEQAGGDQMQAIVQQVAQMLQQGADPQEILQQLVQAGLPEEQAMQVIQMVIEQIQGGQPQATPQLGRGGQMMKRADGSYSKRGMWDNIRDNAGSGKAPTKQMLEQERKINAKYQTGGKSPAMTQAELNSIAKKYNKTPKEFLEIISEGQVSPDGGTMIRLGGGNTGVPKNYLEAYREEQSSIPNTIRRIPEMMKKTANRGLDYLGIDYEFNNGGYYQEGGEEMDEEMEGEDEGAEGETPNMEQIESQVEQALKQGADPEQILQQLVQMGMPEDQAVQMIQEILQEIQGGETEMEGPEQGQPMMKNGGEYLAMMKGKTIKNYTYNKKTGNYDVEFE